ncbi:MAG TPA: selenide, water dikinase SelD [Flavobacteriales bacterium]|nr:selenide, water dikinase SelD [Flavobacteriales bacterium]HHZ97725.1 selenide, water dikinase SelD [Flavobacteriales bacterium]HIB77939.1 selenide, water dikinase SelD [Flavobacteriales bacterium]HIN41646.1 selenide, water dikinase SelD [Flavobacteriales bacterium]HIO15633.1 selenide, water dikinase SelD [Flavobacteriales bacterium]
MSEIIRLTQYSHGAGCGCKIAPGVLNSMLSCMNRDTVYPDLVVGNDTKDDAAVVDLGDGTGIVSTTDFFMPIVDDPHTFGRIAAANAISDIYAMGGTPLMAIAILGWPINKLDPEVAGAVLEGGRTVCAEAGIPLAGGHSIDSPEPIFGLAVTGRVSLANLKENATAHVGDVLFLTKPLGVGMVTTAEKKGLVSKEHIASAIESMTRLNIVGARLSEIKGVHAMTDVTGFGLMGHLLELCQGSGTGAVIDFDAVPTLDRKALESYHAQGCVPGGARRNFESYGKYLDIPEGFTRDLLCDPQTSGGLLVSVANDSSVDEVKSILTSSGLSAEVIGYLTETHPNSHVIKLL